ncbi:MAG: cell division protein ZapA [Bacteroidia bacterium]
MSDKEISIKINICNRFYPLRIKSSEEEKVRKAVKTINDRANYYIQNFSVQDKQDALSMISLEYATQNNESSSNSSELENITNKLTELESLLDI